MSRSIPGRWRKNLCQHMPSGILNAVASTVPRSCWRRCCTGIRGRRRIASCFNARCFHGCGDSASINCRYALSGRFVTISAAVRRVVKLALFEQLANTTPAEGRCGSCCEEARQFAGRGAASASNGCESKAWRLRSILLAIGHRIVHGGPKYLSTRRITPEMLAELRRVAPIDPDHLPGEIGVDRGR